MGGPVIVEATRRIPDHVIGLLARTRSMILIVKEHLKKR